MTDHNFLFGERDKAIIAVVKWRAVLKNATSAKVKLEAIYAIERLEQKIKDTTQPARKET